MPRGDKKQMMGFRVSDSCSSEDLLLLDSAIRQKSSNESETVEIQTLRDTLLPKLMSGEIDVSKVGLMQPANNHLARCKAAALALSHIFSVACWGCGFLCNKVRAVICSHLRCLATFIRISVANEWLKLHLLRYVQLTEE